MKLSSIPVVKLPIVDASTDPLDLLVLGLALRMKQLARTSPKFIELFYVFSLGALISIILSIQLTSLFIKIINQKFLKIINLIKKD